MRKLLLYHYILIIASHLALFVRQAGREYYEQVSEHPRPVGLFPHSLDGVNSPLFVASLNCKPACSLYCKPAAKRPRPAWLSVPAST